MANYDGSAFKVYVKSSAPSVAKDESEYTLVGKVINTSIPGARGVIDISSKDEYPNRALLSGERNESLSLTCRYKHTQDAGQLVLMNQYYAAGGDVYFLVSTNVAGDYCFSGYGVITARPITVNHKAASDVSFTIEVSGVITITVLT